MRRLPPLNALKSFEAAARLSSVSAAAAELGVSHSAVSQQVRLLEDHFGQPLFLRRGRRIEPTPAALRYLEDIRTALDRIAIASEHLSQRRARQAVSLSATPSFAMRWLIPETAAFQLAHPSVQLRLTTSASDGIDHLDQPFDLIFRRDVMAREGHVCRRILPDEALPVLSPGLLARRPLAAPGDLLKASLLHLSSRRDAWSRWLAGCGVRAPDTLPGLHYDHFFLALQAAVSGLGVALAPRVLVADDLASGALVAPFPDRVLPSPGFHVLYRPELARERAGRAVLRWLEQRTGVALQA